MYSTAAKLLEQRPLKRTPIPPSHKNYVVNCEMSAVFCQIFALLFPTFKATLNGGEMQS